MNEPNLQSRRETIMTSAWQVFASYGFRRTSMQDIADAVGISRPALYLEFANKTDIFRALATSLFATNIQRIEAIFAGDQQFSEKLLDSLNICFAEFHHTVEDTPHGEELLSIKAELAGDIYVNWLREVKSAIHNGIEAYITKENMGVVNRGINAAEISEIAVNAMHGLKSGQANEAELRKGAENIVSLVMAALLPK